MSFHSTFQAKNTYYVDEYLGVFQNAYRTHYEVIKRTPKTIIVKENGTETEKRYRIKKNLLDDDLSYEYVFIAPNTRLCSFKCNDVDMLYEFFKNLYHN